MTGPGGDRAASTEAVRRALQSLLRVSASRRVFARRMASIGVTLSQPAVAVLEHVCTSGPLPMGDLARATRNDPGATARQVAALEADGLLVRERSTEDGRISLVRATPEGQRLRERVAAAQARALQEALAAMSDEELAEAAHHLERLAAALRAADPGHGSAAGPADPAAEGGRTG